MSQSPPGRSRPARPPVEVVTPWPAVAAFAIFALLVLGGPLVCMVWLPSKAAPGKPTQGPPPGSWQEARRVSPLPRKEPVPRTEMVEPLEPAIPAESLPLAKTVTSTEKLPPPALRPVEAPGPAVSAQDSPAPAPPVVASNAKLPQVTFKLRNLSSTHELLQGLNDYCKEEVSVDAVAGSRDQLQAAAQERSATLDRAAQVGPVSDADTAIPGLEPLLDLVASRPDLSGLPVRRGASCRTTPEAARQLGEISQFLRGLPRPSFYGSPGFRAPAGLEAVADDPEMIGLLLRANHLDREEAIPGLVQMLQAESEGVRLQLVQMLTAMEGQKASTALARRALFDISFDVRLAAVRALRHRPYAEFRRELLDGLRYPWAPVAEHAAEALAALDDQEVVPHLVGLLDEPDPSLPFKNDAGKWAVRELVRLNHLRNCLLCHAPSTSSHDPVRGLVPTRGEPLPTVYHARGPFVRADITFLKQDFSVMQRVAEAGKWPENQRFDYLIRTRELSRSEATAPEERLALLEEQGPNDDPRGTYPQREAVLFALRELTRHDVGGSSAAWRHYVEKRKP